jgi:hypothetical protein
MNIKEGAMTKNMKVDTSPKKIKIDALTKYIFNMRQRSKEYL